MVRHHSEGDLLQAVIFLAVTGGSLIIHTFRKMQLSRKVEDTPTSLISSAPQGSVELQGYAWANEMIVSPVTQRQCVYYKFVVEEERKSKNSSTWVKVFETQSHNPFGIVDKTGYAMIFPEGAEISASEMIFASPTEAQFVQVQAVLAKNGSGLQLRSGFFSAKKRFKETVIAMGCPLYVLGGFKTITGFRPYPLLPGCDLFFHRIDHFDPKVGMSVGRNISTREDQYKFEALASECAKNFITTTSVKMAAGQDFASMSVETSSVTVSRYATSCGILTHSAESPLYIADVHQKELLKRLGSWALIKFLAGALMLAVAGALLFQKFHKMG